MGKPFVRLARGEIDASPASSITGVVYIDRRQVGEIVAKDLDIVPDRIRGCPALDGCNPGN
jgi:hypothetical protein